MNKTWCSGNFWDGFFGVSFFFLKMPKKNSAVATPIPMDFFGSKEWILPWDLCGTVPGSQLDVGKKKCGVDVEVKC